MSGEINTVDLGGISADLLYGCERVHRQSDSSRGGARRRGSADHLIRLEEEGGRDRQAQCLGGLEVDDQLKFRGLLDGKIRRAGTAKDLVDVRRRASPQVGQTRAVGHQAPFLHVLPCPVDPGQCEGRR